MTVAQVLSKLQSGDIVPESEVLFTNEDGTLWSDISVRSEFQNGRNVTVIEMSGELDYEDEEDDEDIINTED